MTSYESVFEASDGEREFLTRVVPIPGEDGNERVMLVATDITAQVEAEREQQRLADQLQQAQKMESLGQLTGGVAHDFNNILVAISGNLELARMRDADAAEREAHITAALEAAHHAKLLTERCSPSLASRRFVRGRSTSADWSRDGGPPHPIARRDDTRDGRRCRRAARLRGRSGAARVGGAQPGGQRP